MNKYKKKWGWCRKNKIRYYRRLYCNNKNTLYNIFNEDYVDGVLYNIIFNNKYNHNKMRKFYRKLGNSKLRIRNRNTIFNNLHNVDINKDYIYNKVIESGYWYY